MIRKHRINIDLFINNWLPSHKRQTNRKGLLAVLLTPFTIMMGEFVAWRDEAIIRANVTSETISIEWYLNYLFDPTLKRIHIESNDGDGVILGVKTTEPLKFLYFGDKDDEPTAFQYLYKPGETTDLGTASFGVYIPTDLEDQALDIFAIVKIYKLAGKTFVIIPE